METLQDKTATVQGTEVKNVAQQITSRFARVSSSKAVEAIEEVTFYHVESGWTNNGEIADWWKCYINMDNAKEYISVSTKVSPEKPVIGKYRVKGYAHEKTNGKFTVSGITRIIESETKESNLDMVKRFVKEGTKAFEDRGE